jgi:hypothetical protein
MRKVTKKWSSKCFGTGIFEVGLRPKKEVAKYSGRPAPLSKFLNTPLLQPYTFRKVVRL